MDEVARGRENAVAIFLAVIGGRTQKVVLNVGGIVGQLNFTGPLAAERREAGLA